MRNAPGHPCRLQRISPSGSLVNSARQPTVSANRRLSEPQPTSIRYYDWRQVQVPDVATFTPTRPVSVIVPYYQRPDALALTLAALEGQTYPRDLFEVVVVDDGSRSPPELPADTPLDISVVRQERRGFGLARARNNGARAARNDILVFMDGDMIADGGMLEAHARWHHAVSDTLTLGMRHCIDPDGLEPAMIRRHAGPLRELFGDRPCDPDWRERYLRLTDDLTAIHGGHFRAMSGCNFAMHRTFYLDIGGCDESFTEYGFEDIELAYRVDVRGGLLVPVGDALSWHLGRWSAERDKKRRAQRRQRAKVANLIADPGFRRAVPGRTYLVPRYIVTIEVTDESLERIVQAVEPVLAGTSDLVVRIDISARDRPGDIVRLNERFGSDPRLRVAPCRGALDEFAASPLHIRLPARAQPGERFVQRLQRRLGTAVLAESALGDGTRVQIVRAWALHRAHRTGKDIRDFGDARAVSMRAGAFARLRALGPGPGSGIGMSQRLLATPLGRVLEGAKHVRNARTAWRAAFLAWLAGAARWWLRTGRAADRSRPRRPAA